MNCNRLFFFLSPYYLLYLLCLVEKPNSLYTKFPLSSPLGHSCCKLNKFFNFLNIRWCWWYLFSWVNYSWGLDWELGEKVSFFFFFWFLLQDDDKFGNRRLLHLWIDDQNGGNNYIDINGEMADYYWFCLCFFEIFIFIKYAVHYFCYLWYQVTHFGKRYI